MPFRRPVPRCVPVVLLGVLFAAGCTSSSGPTPINPADPPKITCPGPLALTVTGLPVTVTYPSPSVAGGTSPVSIICSPASPSSFQAGTTAVSCSATDSQLRVSSCSFNVAVTVAAPAPRIGATRFVAFGDSITEGKLGPAGFTPDPRFPNSYAGYLYNSLAARYTAQTIDMYDDGFGGERIQPDGVARLPGVLNSRNTQVLLLQEGANDLNLLGDAGIPGVISGLRTMIREARGRGITVFLGTLLPQRAGGRNGLAPASIVPANAQIRTLAASEGAILVDLYTAFGGSPDPLIDLDGLHATAAGYQRIAATFFTAVQSRFETQTSFAPGLVTVPTRSRPYAE